ncbi:MAG: thermonuclease family protein [Rhodobacteraceae bacterium]|nr:thermonuclease family protein [Paracoccaceae bacterium]
MARRNTFFKITFLAAIGGLIALYYPQSADTTGLSDASANCRITHVVDGDTVDLKCEGSQTERIRILGYDTPETYYADCPAEKALGDRATDYLRGLAANGQVTKVERSRQDKYDRTLARIFIDGQDLADIMVSQELAVRYSGARRISWCDRLANSGNN